MTDVQRLRRLLEFAVLHYRYVVVDCPRTDATTLDALEAAARIVLVANQELATLRSGSRMAATLRRRYRPDRVMVIVSRFDTAAEIGHDDVERVIGSSGEASGAQRLPRLARSAQPRQAAILKNHSRLASSLERLARELAAFPRRSGQPRRSAACSDGWTGKR